ncbi:LHFPL tetraspan subfamily member 7 protein-like isoform X1 [Ostrea edulis]|uniref:LHFPL tetraspan subfamily member 7 protein-like isoform X1 n=1 Tax=Ostrea edulis TaxID=37623 RepID=UPI0024AFBC84|nr:LHFPL tetraspan subfamily member 7 protein-like isoform X1 [Ostrea edulis]
MMVSFVFCLWVLLTVAIAVVWSVCLSQPAWVLHPNNLHSFGLQKYCVVDIRGSVDDLVKPIEKTCFPYGKALRMGDLPSEYWRASFLLLSSGTFLLIVSVTIGVLSVFMQEKWDGYVSMMTKCVQTIAVLVAVSALLTYPLGFGSPFFRYYCGAEAGPYNTGHCSMGWTYMLAIMGASLSVFCPILWNFRRIKHYDIIDEIFV